MNLIAASKEWKERPSEERFWNIQELLAAAKEQRQNARESQSLSMSSLTFGDDGEGLVLTGSTGQQATMSHYAFSQLSRLIGCPADYLRQLPEYMSAMLLNHATTQSGGKDVKFLVRQQENNSHIQAATSDGYSRIWNYDIASRVAELASRYNLKNPPGRGIGGFQPTNEMKDTRIATAADTMSCSRIREGDIICPSGMYLSDRDCFMFLVSEQAIEFDGKNYFRGVIVSNSEVGDRSAQITRFLFDVVCGNHIIWNAKNVETTRIVHRGLTADDRFFYGLSRQTPAYLSSDTSFERKALSASHSMLLGDNQEKVLEVLSSKKIGLSEAQSKEVIELAETTPDRGSASPFSVWGVTGGITRLSQKQRYSADRERVDKIGAKVMSMVF